MGIKEFFKPNWKVILTTFIIFFIASFFSLLGVIINAFEGDFTINTLIKILSLIFSYFLACVLINKFSVEYLKKTSITTKLLISSLISVLIFYFIFWIIYYNNLGLNDLLPKEFLFYSIIVSLVFLLCDIKFNWLIGSIYFVLNLFNPITFINYLRDSSMTNMANTGLIPNLIIALIGKYEISLFSFLIQILLGLLILIYLYFFFNKNNKSDIFFLILIILMYVISQFIAFPGYLNLKILVILSILSNVVYLISFLLLFFMFKKK